MKKLLLSTALLCTTILPSLAEDITPKYFDFSNITNEQLYQMIRDDVQLPSNFNLGNDNWIARNTDTYTGGDKFENPIFKQSELNNGVILLGGASNNSQDNRTNFKNAFSLCDFGEQIGKVLVINGATSNLNKAIYSDLVKLSNSEDAPNIPKSNLSFSGTQNVIIFFLLKEATNQNLRVTMDMCAYHNNSSNNLNAFTSFIAHTKENNTSKVEVLQYDSFKSEKALNGFDWKRVSFNCYPNNGTDNAYTYIKLTVLGTTFNDCAYLIKNIQIEKDASYVAQNDFYNISSSSLDFANVEAAEPTGISIYPPAKRYVGDGAPLYAIVEPITSKEPAIVDLTTYGTYENNIFTPSQSVENTDFPASAGSESAKTKLNIYDHVTGITLNHNQKTEDNTIHLTVGETAKINYSLQAAEGANCIFDPETTINVTVGDADTHGKVSFENILTHGEKSGSFDVSVNNGAGTNKNGSPLEIKAKVTDSEEYAATMNLYHYGVSQSITLCYEKSHADIYEQYSNLFSWMEINKLIQLKHLNQSDNSELSQEFMPFVHNKNLKEDGTAPDYQDISYQDYDIEVYTKKSDGGSETIVPIDPKNGVYEIEKILTIQKSTEKDYDTGLYKLKITPLSYGYNDEVFVKINALKAAQANTKRSIVETENFQILRKEPIEKIDYPTSKEYRVVLTSTGFSGIENVAVEEGEGQEAEIYTLQGVRVYDAAPAAGVYIRRIGNKAEKILVK